MAANERRGLYTVAPAAGGVQACFELPRIESWPLICRNNRRRALGSRSALRHRDDAVQRFRRRAPAARRVGCAQAARRREKQIEIVRVPGAFDMPVVARKLALSRRYEALIALGAVIRGQTPHFDYVAGECASGLARIALESGVPVGFGVLTTETHGTGGRSRGRQGGQQRGGRRTGRARDGELAAAPGLRPRAREPSRTVPAASRAGSPCRRSTSCRSIPRSWQDTHRQFADDPEAERVDRDYFKELIEAIAPNSRGARRAAGEIRRDCPCGARSDRARGAVARAA